MDREAMTSTRLEAFSDGVFAIIITFMVIDLKAPVGGGIAALLALWPVFLSYVLSFIVIAIYSMNHHRTFHFVKSVDNGILWSNIALLFSLSLVPFATAYMGENRMNAVSIALYAALLLICGVTFLGLRLAIAQRFRDDEAMRAWNRAAARKNWLGLALYAASIPLAFAGPPLALALIAAVAGMHFLPNIGTGDF